MSFDHQWNKVRRANPDHSANYAQRWRDLAAAGHDIGGEARFVNAMAPRGSRILDAGCGTGRAGGLLIDEGHTVFGVDLDEFLISVAEEDFPSGEWHTGDLADFDFAGAGITEIDVAFCAGNVLSFLDPASRRQTLGNIKSTLKHGGRFVVRLRCRTRVRFRRLHRGCQSHGDVRRPEVLHLGTPSLRS
jgi:SAM-dependent methyltransferase